MTSCTEVRQKLSAYLDGEIDAAGRRSIAEHLEGCAACRHLEEELRDLDRKLLSGRMPAVTPAQTEALLASLKQRLAGPAERPGWGAFLGALLAMPRWSFGVAAAAVLVFAIGLTTLDRSAPVARSVPAARGSGAPVELEIQAARAAKPQASPELAVAGPVVSPAAGSPSATSLVTVQGRISALGDEIDRLERSIGQFTVQARQMGASRTQEYATRRVDEWR